MLIYYSTLVPVCVLCLCNYSEATAGRTLNNFQLHNSAGELIRLHNLQYIYNETFLTTSEFLFGKWFYYKNVFPTFINSRMFFFFMVMDVILYSVAFAALAAASYNDLRTREVPDWLSYALLGAALGLRLLFSAAYYDWTIIAEGLAGFGLLLLVGCVLYYSGQWGGGDSKLLMGVGAILGFPLLSVDSLSVLLSNSLIIFLVASLFAGATYGLVWVIVLALRSFSSVSREFYKEHKQVRLYGIVFLAFFVVATLFSFYLPFYLRLLTVVLSLFPFTSFYLWLFVHSVEKVAFYKRISPYQLTEGDWIALPITVGRVAIPAFGTGATKNQIQKLRALYDRRKISSVLIKQGIPFVPSFLLGFVLTILFLV